MSKMQEVRACIILHKYNNIPMHRVLRVYDFNSSDSSFLNNSKNQ